MTGPQLENARERVIEVGWLLLNKLDRKTREAVLRGRDQLLDLLAREFGEFTWRMPIVQRAEPVLQSSLEPALALKEGEREREARHWDFVFVVTRLDLVTYYKPIAMAVSSRAISAAVLSTARLLPEQETSENQASEGKDQLAQRIVALAMHVLGDLNGLPHRSEPDDFMTPPETTEHLDRMTQLCTSDIDELRHELGDVADTRIEEEPNANRKRPLTFYLRVGWRGKQDIFESVVQAKPWEFPYRLSRLTTAALSTLVILVITAEAWDLGMTQPWLRVVLMSLLTWLGTSCFILYRQRLLVHRGRRQMTEQMVFTNISISIVVGIGMATTYLLLFGVALVVSLTLFKKGLVKEWAAALEVEVTMAHYLIMSGFIASLGLLIGALGASFESSPYFRHITYVDEET